MKYLFSASAICSSLLLFGLATPGHAAIIEFTVTDSAGDLTTSGTIPGSANPVTGIGYPTSDTQLYLTEANIFGTSYSAFVDQIYNGTGSGSAPANDTMVLQGTISGAAFTNLGPTTNLVTIVFNTPGLTATTTATSVAVNFPTDVASITLSGIFAEDLGLTGGTPYTLPVADLTVLTDSAQLAGGQSGNYNITTADIVLNTSAPEPGSWMTMALGLALVGLGTRKKLSQRA